MLVELRRRVTASLRVTPTAAIGRSRWTRHAAALLMAAALSACAGSVTPPVIVTPLPAEARADLHLAAVTTEAGQGVMVTAADTARITQLVIADIQAATPGLINPAAAEAKSMRIVITRYDEGNAAARFMLAGLGQIRLEANVIIAEPRTGQTIGEYKVEKQFSFGGLYGGLTSMQDVEKGFSKSVAALLKPGS